MFIFKFSVFRFTDLIFHTPRATIDRLKYCKYCKKKQTTNRSTNQSLTSVCERSYIRLDTRYKISPVNTTL